MGKASLALDITRHVAGELHKPVGVSSLEMRADELGLKLLSAESDSAARCTRTGQQSSQH
jgi:replicative DNA helicase